MRASQALMTIDIEQVVEDSILAWSEKAAVSLI